MIVVGIDPDADRHGIAIFRDGKLAELHKWTIIELIELARGGGNVLIGMENVMGNKFIYRRNVKTSKTVQSKVAMSIGRCQQSQVELERVFNHYGIAYGLYMPTIKNWADKRPIFEQVTGWTGSSNEDTRSAAYFGWLALNQVRKQK